MTLSWSGGHGRGQDRAGLAGGRVGRIFHLGRQVGELIQGRIHADELRLHANLAALDMFLYHI